MTIVHRPLTMTQLCDVIITYLNAPDDMRAEMLDLCLTTKENEKVINTPQSELPLLIGSLLYESSIKILEARMKTNTPA